MRISNFTTQTTERLPTVENEINPEDVQLIKKAKVKQKTFSEIVVVKHDNPFKEYFDLVMLPVSCYNVFGNAYYSAFGSSNDLIIQVIDWVVESLFFIDILFNFTQEYLDDETYAIVSDWGTIAKRYLKSSFIFDFFAWVPFNMIF